MDAGSVIGDGAVGEILALLGGGAGTLLASLWRASVAGTLIAVPVWLVCRFVPRLPAAARFWLWWLVSAKLLLGLALSAPGLAGVPGVVLRLPARHPAAAPALFMARLAARPSLLLCGAAAAARPRAAAAATPAGAPSAGAAAAIPDASSPDDVPAPASAAAPSLLRPAAPSASPRPPLPLPALLAAAAGLLWTAGALRAAARQSAGWVRGRRLVRDAVPADAETAEAAAGLARALGLRRAPRVLVSAGASSPFAIGLWRPAVVLPAAGLSPSEARMALAHEMAHVRRGDLWLALAPALAETLFFFLPPARLAAAECAASREEACDAAALAATGGAAAGYGRLLVKIAAAAPFAAGRPAGSAGGALAMAGSPGFTRMRRRLRALQEAVQRPAGPLLRRGAVLLVALTVPGLLPWRLRAALPSLTPAAPDPPDLPRYAVVDLGTLGGKFSDAYGLGEDGAVVGTANVFPLGGRGHAFLWRPGDRAPRDLTAGSMYRHSIAYAVNAAGAVAATAYNNPLKPSAFVWSPDSRERGQRRYLGALPGYRYSRVTGINDSGQVAGVSLRSDERPDGAAAMRAFLWEDGRLRDLGTLGGQSSAALAVGGPNTVAGKADTEADGTHAFLWRPETGMRDLGVLPGGRNSAALAVNRRGDAVGYSEAGDSPRRAFASSGGGPMEDLGALPLEAADGDDAVPTSAAYDVNDAGLIVGISSAAPADAGGGHPHRPIADRAVAWLPLPDSAGGGHRLVDLNDRLLPGGAAWTLEAARAVNGRGEIVGVGLIGGRRHACLLVPVRAPAAEEARAGTKAGG